MANQTGRPVASARKLIAAVLGTLAVFVMVFGLGMASWAIVALGGAMLALAIVLSMANVMRRGERTWVVGQGLVKAISEVPLSSAYGRAEIQLTVVAPGLSTADVLIRDPRVPVAKWPRPGDTLPITVDLLDIRRVRIDWSQAADQGESGDPPPPEHYEPAEEYLDDDLLGTPEPPPWTTRDRVWGRGPDEPPAPNEDLILQRPIVVRDTPGGPVLEGQFEAHDDVPRVLPQRARATDPVGATASSTAAGAAAGSAAATQTRRPSPRPRPASATHEGATATANTQPGPVPGQRAGNKSSPTGPWDEAPTTAAPTATAAAPLPTEAPHPDNPAPQDRPTTDDPYPVIEDTPKPRTTPENDPQPTPDARPEPSTTADPEPRAATDAHPGPRTTDEGHLEPRTATGAHLADQPQAATAHAAPVEPTDAPEQDANSDPRAGLDPDQATKAGPAAPEAPPEQASPQVDTDIDLPLDGDPEPAPEFQPQARAAMAAGLIAPPADTDPTPDPDARAPDPAAPAQASASASASASAEHTSEASPLPRRPTISGVDEAPRPATPEPDTIQPDVDDSSTEQAATETTASSAYGPARPDSAGPDEPTAAEATQPAAAMPDTPTQPIAAGHATTQPTAAAPATPTQPTAAAAEPAAAEPAAASEPTVAVPAAAEPAVTAKPEPYVQPEPQPTQPAETVPAEPRDDRPGASASGLMPGAALAGAGFGIALGAAANDAESNRVKEGAPSPRGPWADLEGGYEPDERADDLITAYPSARPGPAGAIHGIGITILVTNLNRSITFYRDTLGFFEIDSGHGSAVLASGDTRLVLRTVHALSGDLGRPIHLNLEVGDVEAVYQELLHKNVRFEHAPRAVNRGDKLELWAATFHDPDGHSIAITQWRATR